MPVFLQFSDPVGLAMAAVFALTLIVAAGLSVVMFVQWALRPAIEAFQKPMPEVQALTSELSEPGPENREVVLNHKYYNIVDCYILPTQEDLEKTAILFTPGEDCYIFCVGNDDFRVDDDGDCYFNNVFCGNSEIYLEAVQEIYEEQAAATLSRLTKVAV